MKAATPFAVDLRSQNGTHCLGNHCRWAPSLRVSSNYVTIFLGRIFISEND